MKSKSALESYIQFKKNFILEFSKELLPKKYFAKNYYEMIQKIVNDNYLKIYFNEIEFDNLFTSNKEKEEVLESFKKNKIAKNIQLVYLLLFKKNIIKSWNAELDDNKRKIKKVCDVYATTIYIALEFDKKIDSNASGKEFFKKIKDDILKNLKGSVDEDVVNNFKNNVNLKNIFETYEVKNRNFLKNYCVSDDLKVSYQKIIKTDSLDNTEMYLSNNSFSNKRLKEFSEKEVTKISSSKNVINSFKKLEIEMVCYDIFKNIHNKKNMIVFINIPDSFINKSNIAFITKTIKMFKKNIFLNISYDKLLEEANLINSLKEKEFNIAVTKTQTEVSFKKLYDIKYMFLEYANDISYSKTINELKLGKINSVIINDITNVDNKKSKGIDYYLN